MKRLLPWFALVLTVPAFAQQFQWPQWGLDPQHQSAVSFTGQALNQNFVNLVYDPLVPQEMAGAAPLYGAPVLLAHYQAPLVDGNDVFMMCKSGTYSIYNYSTQKWGEMKLTWQNGTLVEAWDFDTDWNPPGSLFWDFWEPVFHPALANGYIYIPGTGGSIFKVNKKTGAALTRINPFPTDTGGTTNTIFVAGPITVDGKGNLWYNAAQFRDLVNIYNNDVVDSWLVKVDKFDNITKVSYSTLTVGAPLGSDLCLNAFPTNSDGTIVNGPWPPSPTAVPGSVTCGTQRPGLNVAPAISADGKTLYSVTRAHLISRWTYLVAVNTSNMTQKWITSMRERFKDGCGVPVALGGTLPPNGAPGGCRAGANYGVDPATNGYGGGRVLDDQSSSPVVAPDGSILFGSYTRYNYAQGHLMRFSANGDYLGAFNFGWDVTPGIYAHSGLYSIDIKDNHYGETGSYCNDPSFCPEAPNSNLGRAYPEAYLVTQLSPALRSDALADRGDKLMTIEWSFQNTNTLSCTRNADGSVSCTSDHPNGFEWCVNGFVIDGAGNVYANSEDGWLYRIQQGGIVDLAGCNPPAVTACGGKIFQQLALGAAYTPTSIDAAGRIYSQNAGHLFVAGK